MRGKVMIVDDEPLIRRGITKMIEASSAGWEVVAEADHGVQALERIDAAGPDLVVTDIRMPEMNGVELCRRLSEREQRIDVIVLTAHKDFEFAQAALRYGAIDFLLKPCAAEELKRSLEKAYRLFSDREEQRSRARQEQNRLLEHNTRAWLLGLPMDEQATERLLHTYEQHALLTFAVESYMPEGRDYRADDVRLLQFAALNVMKELFALAGLSGGMTLVQHDRFAVLAERSARLDEYARQVAATLRELLGLSVRCERFEAPLRSLYGKLAAETREGQPKHDTAIPDHAERSRTIQTEIVSLIVQGKTEPLRAYWEQLIAAARRMNVHDAKLEGLSMALALEAAASRVLEPTGHGEAEEPGERGLRVWIDALQPVRDADGVAALLTRQMNAFLWQLNTWLAGKNDKLLDKAIRYIEQHYKDDCSVHDAAQHVHLSVSYFSNLFKKETGESYTSYLTRFRLEKAKILLSNTNMKIAEIAESVGYEDPNYFTTVFRNWVRCSPSEYRRQG